MPDNVTPLGVDRCKLDHDAPCFYWHLKLRALNGGRDASLKPSPRSSV